MPQNSPTPPNPLTAGLPATQAQTHMAQPSSPLSSPLTSSPIPAWLSYPSPASAPKRSPTRPALPYHAGTDPHGPAAQPAIFPVTNSPILAQRSYPSSLLRQNPAHPTRSRHAGTAPHNPAPHSLSSPLTNSPIPAHLSSPSDLYKNPGSRPPPGFFVISGSVRFPLQRRLR